MSRGCTTSTRRRCQGFGVFTNLFWWISLVIVAGGCSQTISDKEIRYVNLAEVRKLLDSKAPNTVVLIDPRSTEEFARGHIPGARNVQLSEVSGKKDDIDPALDRFQHIVVYGDTPASGPAISMTKRLMASRYRSVRLFPGGLAEWRGANLPVKPGPDGAGSAPGSSR